MGVIVRELGCPLRRSCSRAERSAIAKVARENSGSSSSDEEAAKKMAHNAATSLQLAEQLEPARLIS